MRRKHREQILIAGRVTYRADGPFSSHDGGVGGASSIERSAISFEAIGAESSGEKTIPAPSDVVLFLL